MKSNYSEYKNVKSVPAGACRNYVMCGNITPGGIKNAAEMCEECLDYVRSRGRGHNIEVSLKQQE